MIHLDITHKLIINIENGWFPSLCLTLTFAYLCHFTNTSLFLDSLFSFTVLFSSPLCIIPLLTSIKSLHPQTDRREGLSVSLLIPSLLDKIDHRFHQNNNDFFCSPESSFSWKYVIIFSTSMHDSLNNTCMIPNCVSVPKLAYR